LHVALVEEQDGLPLALLRPCQFQTRWQTGKKFSEELDLWPSALPLEGGVHLVQVGVVWRALQATWYSV
jgi:hypothetical protein